MYPYLHIQIFKYYLHTTSRVFLLNVNHIMLLLCSKPPNWWLPIALQAKSRILRIAFRPQTARPHSDPIFHFPPFLFRHSGPTYVYWKSQVLLSEDISYCLFWLPCFYNHIYNLFWIFTQITTFQNTWQCYFILPIICLSLPTGPFLLYISPYPYPHIWRNVLIYIVSISLLNWV